MTGRALPRGKSGAERRLGERFVDEVSKRRAAAEADAVDFDVAEADAEVDDARRAAAEDDRHSQAGREQSPRPRRRVAEPEPARGARRLPDLSVLPPLLTDTGSFEALRERLGMPGLDIPGTGRHAGLTAVPHGAKSYLAAALATAGERLCWVARDAEIGDRVAEELQAWLGDPERVTILEPRTALAYERSELVADETAARVSSLAAWRTGRASILVASVQALLQHTIRPEDLPVAPHELRTGDRLRPDGLLAELFDLGYMPAAANSRGGAGSLTSSRHRVPCRSGSSSSGTRSTPCARSIPPTNAVSRPSNR